MYKIVYWKYELLNPIKNFLVYTEEPTLSIICVFRNCKERIEPTLHALYSIERITFEMILIDDASTDGSAETLDSLLEHYQHELTFFYRQETVKGRGNSLNSVLDQVRGRVLWFPEYLFDVDQEKLSRALECLVSSQSPLAMAITDDVPSSATDWLNRIQNNLLPCDRNYLFDLQKIMEECKFVDPHWTKGHASEWAIRLLSEFEPVSVPLFAEGEKEHLVINDRIKTEGVLALLRTSKLSPSGQETAFRFLRSYEQADKKNSNPDFLTEQTSSEAHQETFSETHKVDSPETTQESSSEVHESDSSETHSGNEEIQPAPLFFRSRVEEEISQQPSLVIIIPTATNRRPLLEDCLDSVFRYTLPERTRIIVVDNGSVDDTPEFLEKLLRDNRSLTVLTNDRNTGFAAAVNQGLAKAGEGPVVVMHNDVIFKSPVPGRLAHALENHSDIGLIVPRTDRTWNKWQSTEGNNSEIEGPGSETIRSGEEKQDSPVFIDVERVDGYCMAFRNEPGLTMSKQYGLAYFEDVDFCFRIQNNGFRTVIAHREKVKHLAGKTTGDLGLTMQSKGYWENAALFHQEWDREPQFPAEHITDDPLRQFVLLGELINPFYPEKKLLDHFHTLFTSEQKTRVCQSEFPAGELKSLIRLMMAAKQRDVLRSLEQQLDSFPPDTHLYYDLITFYFDCTIYSRCKIYLNKLEETELPEEMLLYKLSIAMGEKDYAYAASLIQDVMDRIPTHPEVFAAASEIHRKNGNLEQSEKFLTLAKKLNPYIKVHHHHR